MTHDTQQSCNASQLVQDDLVFTITMEKFNSAFGISADTLRALADSYGTTPEALVIRAVTMWARADIPDLDLDSPRLTEAQFEFLANRRRHLDAGQNQPLQSLQETFKRLFEGMGDSHENAELSSRNGGNS